jgi:transcriptional regulator GlxA family with amidase domain
VELGAVGKNLERDLVERILDKPTLPKKVAAVEAALMARARTCEKDSSVEKLVATMVSYGGQVSLDFLASMAGVSARQLERRFLREVGISPKLLCRILRFQQIFRSVNENDDNWASVAVNCGYYDQAHLIRDFKSFAGQTPAVFNEQPSALTEAFTRKNRMSVFSNTTA